MRPHVRAATRCEVPRTHVVEEDEWADHLTMANRQHAAHGVAITKIADAALQDIDDRLGVFGHGSLVSDGDWRIRQPLVATCVSLRAVRSGARSEERRVGKEWVSTCRSRGSPYH